MSGIGGKVREQVNFEVKKVGLFSGKVVAVNPNIEEYKEILGITLGDDSKATEYLGQSKEGNTTLRINIWLESLKGDFRSPVTFFLEDKKKTNRTEEGDGKVKKYQYINDIGVCSWADDPDNLPDWFTKRDYRVAFVGEEELYTFMRTWLGKLDYKDAESVLQIDWKQLMKGNIKDIKAQIDGEFCTPVVAMATVKTVDKDEEVKEYQGIYNKLFLPEYSLKQFRLIDYSKPENQAKLKAKKSSDLKPHERFVLQVTHSEYGCKDYYSFNDLREYDPSENLIASNAPISAEGPDY